MTDSCFLWDEQHSRARKALRKLFSGKDPRTRALISWELLPQRNGYDMLYFLLARGCCLGGWRLRLFSYFKALTCQKKIGTFHFLSSDREDFISDAYWTLWNISRISSISFSRKTAGEDLILFKSYKANHITSKEN